MFFNLTYLVKLIKASVPEYALNSRSVSALGFSEASAFTAFLKCSINLSVGVTIPSADEDE